MRIIRIISLAALILPLCACKTTRFNATESPDVAIQPHSQPAGWEQEQDIEGLMGQP